MTMSNHDAPFPLGGTYFGTTQTASTGAEQWLGRTFYFRDVDPSDNGAFKSGHDIKVRVVLNSSGITLTGGGQLASMTVNNGRVAEVDGYSSTTAELYVAPIDPYVDNVYPNDLFYVVDEGPCLVKTGAANGEGNSIAVGDLLIAATVAASTNTTAGRISKEVSLSASSQLTDYKTVLDAARGAFARALSAATTNETDTAIRAYVLPKTW